MKNATPCGVASCLRQLEGAWSEDFHAYHCNVRDECDEPESSEDEARDGAILGVLPTIQHEKKADDDHGNAFNHIFGKIHHVTPPYSKERLWLNYSILCQKSQ